MERQSVLDITVLGLSLLLDELDRWLDVMDQESTG
jgi:hypothetical protein